MKKPKKKEIKSKRYTKAEIKQLCKFIEKEHKEMPYIIKKVGE